MLQWLVLLLLVFLHSLLCIFSLLYIACVNSNLLFLLLFILSYGGRVGFHVFGVKVSKKWIFYLHKIIAVVAEKHSGTTILNTVKNKYSTTNLFVTHSSYGSFYKCILIFSNSTVRNHLSVLKRTNLSLNKK